MKFNKLGTSIIAASLALATAPAHAVETGIDWLHVSGFGTLAATRSDLNKSGPLSYAPNIEMEKGTVNEWNLRTDSRLGVQATADINSDLSATLQVVSRQNATGGYTPTATLANVKYNITPDAAVRVGRIGPTIFLISDYVNVGYSQPWIRPPVTVYRGMINAPVDGMDGLFRFHVGDITFSVQPGIGKGSFQSPISGQVAETEISRIRNLALSAEFGPWTVRYANLRSKSTIEGVTGFEIKDNFNNIGVVYDKDAWLVMAEYAWRTTNETAGLGKLDLKSAYVTTGYRIDKVMPYVTFGRFIDESDTGAMATTENTTELGVRWDLYKNIALKAQWDHITRPSGRFDTPGSPGYAGLFRRTPAGVVTTDDKPVNVFAVGLDFVF